MLTSYPHPVSKLQVSERPSLLKTKWMAPEEQHSSLIQPTYTHVHTQVHVCTCEHRSMHTHGSNMSYILNGIFNLITLTLRIQFDNMAIEQNSSSLPGPRPMNSLAMDFNHVYSARHSPSYAAGFSTVLPLCVVGWWCGTRGRALA